MSHLTRLPDECRFPYLSPAELLARLEQKAILYLPIGSLEWHNEHLPLGTDTLHAIEISVRLCREIGGVALPAFWWNTGGCHDHASTYHMPEDLYRTTLRNVIVGLKSVPAKLLVLINGHGGGHQRDSVPAVAAELTAARALPMRVIAADPYHYGKSSSCQIDHADTGETSLSLELIGPLVRLDRDLGADLYTGNRPFAAAPATAAGGRELWNAYLSDVKTLIAEEYRRAGA
ncbi:MAG: creatininase family protein [Planctomycetaceae bacterium]|nr:creatininase family protein [Planctomycetaceae bacterium]